MASPPDGRLIGGGAVTGASVTGGSVTGGGGRDARFAEMVRLTTKRAAERLESSATASMPRRALAEQISAAVGEVLSEGDYKLDLSAQRDLVSVVLDELSEQGRSGGGTNGLAGSTGQAPIPAQQAAPPAPVARTEEGGEGKE